MPVPEPFNLSTLSAGILIDIAAHILKRYVQVFGGTPGGCLLQRSGLIEPYVDDRLSDISSKALRLYFYAPYKLTDITVFFLDPTFARPIGRSILDRELNDYGHTRQAFDWDLVSDGATKIFIGRNV